MTEVPTLCSALADTTRWSILQEIGWERLSASALATRLPVSRQAITRHLAVLEGAGLVSADRVGREVRYRALGSSLSKLAHRLEGIGAEWDRRLDAVARIAEDPRSDRTLSTNRSLSERRAQRAEPTP